MSTPTVSSGGKTTRMPPSQGDPPPTHAPAQAEPANPALEETVKTQVPPMVETQPTEPLHAAQDSPPLDPGPPASRSDADQPGARPISGWVLIAVAGVVVLLILAGIGLLLAMGHPLLVVSTPTPTLTLTPTWTSTPAPSPTRPPTRTPVAPTLTPVLPTSTPRPAPTGLGVGVLARVTPPEGFKLKVRDRAGTGGQILGELEPGVQVKIVEGPTEANGFKWWKVDDGKGLAGWSAEGSGGDVYLVLLGWAP